MNSELSDVAKIEKPRRGRQSERCRIILLNEAAEIGAETMGKICHVFLPRNRKKENNPLKTRTFIPCEGKKAQSLPLPKGLNFRKPKHMRNFLE